MDALIAWILIMGGILLAILGGMGRCRIKLFGYMITAPIGIVLTMTGVFGLYGVF